MMKMDMDRKERFIAHVEIPEEVKRLFGIERSVWGEDERGRSALRIEIK